MTTGAAVREIENQNTVLIVDDDTDLRESLGDVLRNQGYAVTLAANGKEALELLPGLRKPRGIVLDIAMPVMNGPQFYQAMRAVPELADTPVVILTCDPALAPKGVPKMTKLNPERMLSMVAALF